MRGNNMMNMGQYSRQNMGNNMTRVGNIYQMLIEDDIDNLISIHKEKLTLMFFSDSIRLENETKSLKFFFKQFSYKHPEGLFLYVDINNYTDVSGRYTTGVNIPRFVLYYNGHEIFHDESFKMENTISEYEKLRQRILTHRNTYQVAEEDDDDGNVTEYEYVSQDYSMNSDDD